MASLGGKRHSSRALQPECAAHRALGLVHAFTCFLPGLGLLQGRHFHVSWPAVFFVLRAAYTVPVRLLFFVDGRSLFSFLHQVSRQRVVTDAFAIFCTVTRPGLGPFHSEAFFFTGAVRLHSTVHGIPFVFQLPCCRWRPAFSILASRSLGAEGGRVGAKQI